MKRPVGSPSLRTNLCAMFNALVFTCATATAALAQHGGGHMGVGGHVAPPAPHPASSRPVSPAPVRSPSASPIIHGPLVMPPVIRTGPSPSFRVGYPFPHHPIFPRRPIFPTFPLPPHGFGVFGIPFFGLGFGWGFYGGPWLGCSPLLYWGYACNGLPAYEYGPGNYSSPVEPYSPEPQAQVLYQNWPLYFGETNSQYAQLFLDDGTVYNVTDYWLVKGELHFKTVEEHGTKVVEHTIDFDRLDLQRTIDVNTDRGFRFVLRNEPIEQYLIDHPSLTSPDEAPAGLGPDEPQPAPAPEQP